MVESWDLSLLKSRCEDGEKYEVNAGEQDLILKNRDLLLFKIQKMDIEQYVMNDEEQDVMVICFTIARWHETQGAEDEEQDRLDTYSIFSCPSGLDDCISGWINMSWMLITYKSW